MTIEESPIGRQLQDRGAPADHRGGHGHGWMMIACCIPMLVIAVALVATGAVNSSFLLVALMCTAMMALMMGGMHGGHKPDGPSR